MRDYVTRLPDSEKLLDVLSAAADGEEMQIEPSRAVAKRNVLYPEVALSLSRFLSIARLTERDSTFPLRLVKRVSNRVNFIKDTSMRVNITILRYACLLPSKGNSVDNFGIGEHQRSGILEISPACRTRTHEQVY